MVKIGHQDGYMQLQNLPEQQLRINNVPAGRPAGRAGPGRTRSGGLAAAAVSGEVSWRNGHAD